MIIQIFDQLFFINLWSKHSCQRRVKKWDLMNKLTIFSPRLGVVHSDTLESALSFYLAFFHIYFKWDLKFSLLSATIGRTFYSVTFSIVGSIVTRKILEWLIKTDSYKKSHICDKNYVLMNYSDIIANSCLSLSVLVYMIHSINICRVVGCSSFNKKKILKSNRPKIKSWATPI